MDELQNYEVRNLMSYLNTGRKLQWRHKMTQREKLPSAMGICDSFSLRKSCGRRVCLTVSLLGSSVNLVPFLACCGVFGVSAGLPGEQLANPVVFFSPKSISDQTLSFILSHGGEVPSLLSNTLSCPQVRITHSQK